jgi:LDH2 family malate/lactate/ureidoglycolate dehydrogenase
MTAMRIVVLTGAPGAGKTTAARALIELCPLRAGLVETDAMAAIHPWRVDDDFHRLVGDNLRACLRNYRDWGAGHVVLAGVVVPDGIYRELEPLLGEAGFEWQFYGLKAAPEALRQRIWRDPKPQEPAQRERWMFLDQVIESIPGIHLVDTTGRRPEEIAATIAAAEGWIAPAVSAPPAAAERVRLADARRICAAVLERAGAPAEVAELVVDDLLLSDAVGYSSHGILRVPQYVEEIARGSLDPAARPDARAVTSVSRVVDGGHGFGALAKRRIARELIAVLADNPVAVVGLERCTHLGRLAPLLESVAGSGAVAMAFANFGGGHQKVAPWGGSEVRLSTNPIGMSFPAGGEPVTIDLSTSQVAEGAIRAAMLAGAPVPPGWLVDRNWRSVTDPGLLYQTPPAAMMTPLGGDAGHKGFALSLAVEILAGILARAGHARPGAPELGNGGLFLALRPDVLGSSLPRVRAEVDALVDYCLACPEAPGFTAVRIPGRRLAVARALDPSAELPVSVATWQCITELAAAPAATPRRGG